LKGSEGWISPTVIDEETTVLDSENKDGSNSWTDWERFFRSNVREGEVKQVVKEYIERDRDRETERERDAERDRDTDVERET
jgi:hypothetical protein